MLAHWPQHPVARRRVGMGDGIADFQALMQPPNISDPTQGGSAEFAAAWGGVEAQLSAEGVPDANGLIDMTGAKLAMTKAFNEIAGSDLGLEVKDAAAAAQNYVLMGKSVLGSVSMVTDMIGNAAKGTLMSFTGTMIGELTSIAVTTGAMSAGLGAAITIGLGAILTVMGEAGLLGTGSATIGATPICNFPLVTKPDSFVGCLGMWGAPTPPHSPDWNSFPDPHNAVDAAWFNTNLVGPGTWGKSNSFYGVRAPGFAQGYAAASLGSKNTDSITKWNPNDRPIDLAFSEAGGSANSAYRAIVEGLFPGPVGFPEMLRSAWKANAEYLLNGIAAQPDWMVLVHALRLWNRAHLGPSVVIQPAVGMAANVYGVVATLVDQAHQGVPNPDPLLYGSVGQGTAGLNVNVGPLKNVPVAGGHLTLADLAPSGWKSPVAAAAPPMSTGAKVAVGASAVGGAALLTTAVYSAVIGSTVGAVLQHVWRKVRGK